MKAIYSFFQIRALMLAALVLTSFPCMAQSIGTSRAGTIVLPTETHWGEAVLPAGQYTFKIDTSNSLPTVIVRSVTGDTAVIVVPESQSLPDQSGKGTLVLAEKGGVTYVKSLSLAEVGLEFDCVTHKKKRVVTAQAAAQPPAYSTPAK